MFEVVLLNAAPSVKIIIGHRLDDEPLIFAEEEKAARFALGLSCLEDHLAVGLRVERFAQNLIAVAIFLA